MKLRLNSSQGYWANKKVDLNLGLHEFMLYRTPSQHNVLIVLLVEFSLLTREGNGVV